MLQVKNKSFEPGTVYTLMSNKFGNTELVATCSNIITDDYDLQSQIVFTNVLKVDSHKDNPDTAVLRKLLRGASINSPVTLWVNDIFALGELTDHHLLRMYKEKIDQEENKEQ